MLCVVWPEHREAAANDGCSENLTSRPYADVVRVEGPTARSTAAMPSTTPSHSLATPTPDEWRAEVRQRRAARKAAREAGQQQQQAQ